MGGPGSGRFRSTVNCVKMLWIFGLVRYPIFLPHPRAPLEQRDGKPRRLTARATIARVCEPVDRFWIRSARDMADVGRGAGWRRVLLLIVAVIYIAAPQPNYSARVLIWVQFCNHTHGTPRPMVPYSSNTPSVQVTTKRLPQSTIPPR